MPNFSKLLDRDSPWVGIGTRKAVMPLCFSLLSTVAKTTAALPTEPLVTQDLVPFKTKLSPSSRAVIVKPTTSLPASRTKRISQELRGGDENWRPTEVVSYRNFCFGLVSAKMGFGFVSGSTRNRNCIREISRYVGHVSCAELRAKKCHLSFCRELMII